MDHAALLVERLLGRWHVRVVVEAAEQQVVEAAAPQPAAPVPALYDLNRSEDDNSEDDEMMKLKKMNAGRSLTRDDDEWG